MLLVLVMLCIATFAFAQKFNLGDFPTGRWLDAQNNAVWEFSATNIRILDSKTGAVQFDFSDNTIRNFNLTMSGMNPTINFSCPEANDGKGKTYAISSNIPNTSLILKIDRPGQAQYTVTMPKQ